MTAYVQALGQGDSTLILSPSSEFFQYFNSEVPKPATTDAAPAQAK